MKSENNIKGFTITETLHRGNVTVLHRAIRESDKAKVILKVLAKAFPTTSEIAYLTRENETLKAIDFEGVSKVIDFINYENRPVLVMNDIGGISLTKYLITEKITLQSFLKIAIKITNILGMLHAKNIMHKDINPENIIINKDTTEVCIIDFGIATRLSRERTAVRNPNILEGTLQYMSPEQTGRMNRSTDYRTDLYSLGITFYKMLTGTVPFPSTDAMELVHCHIAKKIVPLHEFDKAIPVTLSAIVEKLTAKVADDRYQTTAGLLFDLEQCQNLLNTTGSITGFEIGKNDRSNKFIIPEKLYGRKDELSLLHKVYEEIVVGKCELFLISGSSGIGKTSLINEINKTTFHRNGYFIAGKFDQFKSNIPFNGFALAFTDLFQQLVSESKHKIEHVKKQLNDVLGLNASVLLALMPQFSFFLGNKSVPKELNPAESQNRFFFTLRDFISVFATSEHPLTIFLDDLQWADDASLKLLKEVITKEIPHLLILGAYRNNEVNALHPLIQEIEEIQKVRNIHNIVLSTLTEQQVNEMVADTLATPKSETTELSNLIFRLTAGNPFYIIELLKNIYNDELINFDPSTKKWIWNAQKINDLNVAGNVVELVTARLKELPLKCLEILKIASCLGNTFDINTLAVVTGISNDEIVNLLWPAIEEEIIFAPGNDYSEHNNNSNVQYKFLHDRIQHATYTLIDSNEQSVMHLNIARQLIQTKSNDNSAKSSIEIVRHYNHGSHLITNIDEKNKLAQLNLSAGIKAQSAVAYSSALQYFKTGIDLLPSQSWTSHYQLTYDLYKGYAQNAYQINKIEVAESSLRALLDHAKTKLEKADILAMQARQYTTLNKALEAIAKGIEGLAILGIDLSPNPGALSVLKEVLLVKWNVGKRKASDLLNLPIMADAEKQAAARLLMEIGPSAYVTGNDNLYGLTSLMVVNLCLKHGNCPQASFAYITYGAVLAEAFGDYQSCKEFGNLGVDLNLKLDDIEYRCRTIAAYGVLSHHRDHHLSKIGDWFKKGVVAGYQSGDLFFLTACASNSAFWNPLLNLDEKIAEQEKYMKVIRDAGYQDGYDVGAMLLQVSKNFNGGTSHPLTMSDAYFDEEKCVAGMKERNYVSGVCMFHINKASIYLFHEEYEKSYLASLEAYKLIKSLPSFIYNSRFIFNNFLACAGYIIYGNNPPVAKLKKTMKTELAKMKKLAKYNPENFYHLQLIMEAEQANVENNTSLAATLYERAIKYSNENNWPSNEAMANELAAKFYYRNKIRKAAAGYMQEAFYLYDKWRGNGKTILLKEHYPKLLSTVHVTASVMPVRKMHSAPASLQESNGLQLLDFASIVKSSQAISGEIEFEKLLQKIMALMLENAGAQRGVILLDDNGALNVMAEIDDHFNVTMLKNLPVSKFKKLPHTAINYVLHTKDALVLDNAEAEGRFTNDDYIKENKCRSIICLPIQSQAKLTGILYLENNIAEGAFTQERTQVLNLMASQAAISIENAKLYNNTTQLNQTLKTEINEKIKVQDELRENERRLELANQTLEHRVEERTAELTQTLENLQRTQAQLIHAEKMASLGQLTAGIAHEIKNPLNFINNFSALSQELMSELLESNDEEEKKELATDITENLKKIVAHGKRADTIVSSMLLHSRTGNNEKQLTDINMLVKESINFSYHSIRAQTKMFECNMNVNLDETLPMINVKVEEINRVILNLCNNAMQAMHERKQKETEYLPELTITTKHVNNNVSIKVKDNGPGIKAEVRDKIFEPFFTTKPAGQGTGLGLSLSYEIIKDHNGTIRLESTPGNGCEFEILIPIT